MKKVLALALALIMAMSVMVACGEKFESPAASSVELLNGAYDAFAEKLAPLYEMEAADLKMMFPGGYIDENDETTMTQGPGNVPVDNVILESVGLFPTDMVSMIDNAALVQHPMMQNYFVTVAYHVAALENVDTVASAIADSVKNNQWMCGQPEGYYVITAGDYVVLTYGLFDNINPMKEAITETYTSATVITEGSFIG